MSNNVGRLFVLAFPTRPFVPWDTFSICLKPQPTFLPEVYEETGLNKTLLYNWHENRSSKQSRRSLILRIESFLLLHPGPNVKQQASTPVRNLHTDPTPTFCQAVWQNMLDTWHTNRPITSSYICMYAYAFVRKEKTDPDPQHRPRNRLETGHKTSVPNAHPPKRAITREMTRRRGCQNGGDTAFGLYREVVSTRGQFHTGEDMSFNKDDIFLRHMYVYFCSDVIDNTTYCTRPPFTGNPRRLRRNALPRRHPHIQIPTGTTRDGCVWCFATKSSCLYR